MAAAVEEAEAVPLVVGTGVEVIGGVTLPLGEEPPDRVEDGLGVSEDVGEEELVPVPLGVRVMGGGVTRGMEATTKE